MADFLRSRFENEVAALEVAGVIPPEWVRQFYEVM
jgi:hypothetical protein